MFNLLTQGRTITAFALLVVIVAVACGGSEPAQEATAAPTQSAAAPQQSATAPPAQAGSLQSAPPATAALNERGIGTSDAPRFPTVTPSEPLPNAPSEVPEDLKIIWEAFQFLLQDYVDQSKLDTEAMAAEAIRGMTSVLEDSQTSYVSPEVLTGRFGDVFRGEFEGIGAYVDMNPRGMLVIVSPIAGSPAEEAGIRPGDIVLEVDGEKLEGLSILEAVSKIRGPRGSKVKLLIRHLGAIDPELVEVVRGVIPLTSVLLRSQPGDSFAHIRVTDFYPDTADELGEMIQQTVADGAKGLILDLRGNGGGLLQSAVDIASHFLDEGLVLYMEYGDGRRQEWKVQKGGVAKELPMVVLQNQGSASSSEVLTGALQDHQRAEVIGSISFGKGSVNHLRDLSNGGGLYITIAHWFTPLGRLIEAGGITPDIEVTDRDPREADVKQLERAIEELEKMTGVKNREEAAS